jgi:hypothetical protein
MPKFTPFCFTTHGSMDTLECRHKAHERRNQIQKEMKKNSEHLLHLRNFQGLVNFAHLHTNHGIICTFQKRKEKGKLNKEQTGINLASKAPKRI